MKNSETLEDFHERNRSHRVEKIREWAAYVRTNPDQDWGKQVNSIVDSQLQSARYFEDLRPDPEALTESSLFDR